MLVIRANRAKLWETALIGAFLTGFLLILFLQPQILPTLYGKLLSGDFGHYVTVPPLAVLCAVLTFRAAWLAAGPLDALVADEDGVTVMRLRGSCHIPWSQLMAVRLVRTRYRGVSAWSISLDRRGRGAITLSLAMAALPLEAYDETVRSLTALCQAANRPIPAARSLLATRSSSAASQIGFGRRSG